jgi:excinuclease ABC subunit C
VPLYIDKNSESLKLIQNLRNEAHRFGINFHRQKRSGTMTKSQLEEVPGIGARSIELLFNQFKSLQGINNASEEELAKAIGTSRAKNLKAYLRKKNT